MNTYSSYNHHNIVVDGDVFAELQKRAVPLVDDANSVLGRLLNLSDSFDGSISGDEVSLPAAIAPNATERSSPQRKLNRPPGGRKRARARAPKGSLLPEEEYERPLLQALDELGGSAPSADVIDLVGTKIEDRLTELDRQTIKSGDLRWRNRTQFVRLDLVKRGLMVKDSPRGTWAITDEGRDLVRKEQAND